MNVIMVILCELIEEDEKENRDLQIVIIYFYEIILLCNQILIRYVIFDLIVDFFKFLLQLLLYENKIF